MLKALNLFAGANHAYYRIASFCLAHAKPPLELVVTRKREKLAAETDCSKRSVEDCFKWLRDTGLATIKSGRGPSAITVIDFQPLGALVEKPQLNVALPGGGGKDHTGTHLTPHCGHERPHSATAVY